MICKRCKLGKGAMQNLLPIKGNNESDVLIMGSIFNQYQIETLYELIEFIETETPAVTYPIKCYTSETVTRKEFNKCFINVWNDIAAVDPMLIVVLDEVSLYQVSDKLDYKNLLGSFFFSNKVNTNVLVAGYEEDNFKKIDALINEEPKVAPHYDYTYISSVPEWEDIYYATFTDVNDIYLDLETDSLDPYTGDITLLQIGTEKSDIFVVDASVLKYIIKDIKFLLTTKNVIGQDFTFDAKWMFVKYNIMINHWYHDTCLAEFLLTGFKDNDLSSLTAKYNPEYYGYDDEVKNIGGAHLVKNFNQLKQYAADDIGTMFVIK